MMWARSATVAMAATVCAVAAVSSEEGVRRTVERAIANMTVAEKARQLDIFRAVDMLSNGRVNMTKAAESLGDLSLGFGTMHDVYPYPEIANEMMAALINASRLGTPPSFGAEATHGLQMDGHTIFPSPIGLAATFDRDLMRAYGQVVASETRAAGMHVAWAPVLGLCREPRWGRCEEMMGEDTHLAAELGRATAEGMTDGGNLSSPRAVAPLAKHYVAYSVPEGGHNCAPAHMGHRELLSDFLPPFVAGIEAGVQGVMVSYNEVDGVPNAASHYLLTEVLRDGAGGGPQPPFGGYVSADFGAIANLNGVHDVAADAKQAIAQYLIAGGSVSGFDFDHHTWQSSIAAGIEDGSLPAAVLDEAVSRVLSVKARLGLFEDPLVADTEAYDRLVASKEHEAVALEAARKSMVLLQNAPDVSAGLAEPVLPLDASKVQTIAVLGPNADQPQCGDYAAGGSWGGDKCGGGPVNNARTVSILGGIKDLGIENVIYAPGVPVSDYNASAPYFTTVQRHSFSTLDGDEGLTGTYYASGDFSGPVALTRNDYMLSFHFLNYGPDAKMLPQSEFSAIWEGYLTPDCTVDRALFSLTKRGGEGMSATLNLDDVEVMRWEGGEDPPVSSPVSLVRGRPVHVRFAYAQEDKTGTHPAFALQWSLQGAHAMQDALDAVSAADAVVVAVGGGTSVTSGEGIDRSSMGLPGTQLDFLKAVRGAVISAGKPMATVILQGKPLGEQWVKQSLPAVLEAWQAGQAQGQAVAEVLFGHVNPAGRTAVSFPTSADVLPVYYSRKPSASRGGYHNPPLIPGGLYPPSSPSSASVLWAFGHGLSYGSTDQYVQFAYTNLTIAPATVPIDGEVKVSVTITNNGTLAAEEVAQLYVRDELASVTTPVMQLRGFERTKIEAGTAKQVSFTVDVKRHLWLINRAYEKVVEPGTFTLMVGGASDMIQQTGKLEVVEDRQDFV